MRESKDNHGYVSYSLVFGVLILAVLTTETGVLELNNLVDIKTFSMGITICFLGASFLVVGQLLESE